MTRRKTNYKKAAEEVPLLLTPKNENQQRLLNALRGSAQVIVLGPAGTGKTYVTTSYAAYLYKNKLIDKIIITRPNVSAGKSLGFFPGTLEEKMMPWTMPIFEVLFQKLGRETVNIAVKNGNIEIAPFETMRGRSFNDCFVILDEAQNVSPHEMKMFNTRIGENVTMVINGDIMQSDLPGQSGLADAIFKINKYKLPVPIIEFSVNDIVRSELCKAWIMAYLREDAK